MSLEWHTAQIKVRGVEGKGQQLSRHLPARRERPRGTSLALLLAIPSSRTLLSHK